MRYSLDPANISHGILITLNFSNFTVYFVNNKPSSSSLANFINAFWRFFYLGEYDIYNIILCSFPLQLTIHRTLTIEFRRLNGIYVVSLIPLSILSLNEIYPSCVICAILIMSYISVELFDFCRRLL